MLGGWGGHIWGATGWGYRKEYSHVAFGFVLRNKEDVFCWACYMQPKKTLGVRIDCKNFSIYFIGETFCEMSSYPCWQTVKVCLISSKTLDV